MFMQPSQSEILVLEALQGQEPVSLEDITGHIPELSWSQVFHAVDLLSRRGDLILQRRGFSYYLSRSSLSCVPT